MSKTITKAEQGRLDRILPDGKPRYIHCYDNGGETCDRYTVCFTGNYTNKTSGSHLYVGMSGEPFHPQGFGQHGENRDPIDYPRYGHLGKKIKFDDLPMDCQSLVMQDYVELWGLLPHIQAEGRAAADAARAEREIPAPIIIPYAQYTTERYAFVTGARS